MNTNMTAAPMQQSANVAATASSIYANQKPSTPHSSVIFDPDKWLELARRCEYLPENDMKALCDIVAQQLIVEANIVEVQVCHFIHFS